MIRAHRVAATAHDDASLISGWNIAPNVEYSVALTPGSTSCGVFLFAEDGALVASGAALVGTEQPCVLIPQSGQTIGMIDAELGWHLLLTTMGAEQQRTIRINPAVDLPDEIHPIYGDDDLALVRATAGIDGAAHYIDDLTVSCPLGLGAGLGAIASVPVDGVAVVGQAESITWAGTPNGASEQAVIRRHVAIAPVPAVAPPAPPTVADDEAETDATAEASGNVLTNDESGLTVTAVNGLSANVGAEVAGDNGGVFVIDEDGAWTFDPDGDFAALTGTETAETSVTYHASDGGAEASATLTVTVSSSVAAPTDPYWSSVVLLLPMTGADGSTTFTDVKGHTVTRGTPLVVETGDGPQEVTSYGDCNITGTSQNTDVLTVAHASDLNIGNQDFCIDLFIRWNATPSASYFSPVIFNKGIGASAMECRFFYFVGQLYFQVSSNGSTITTVFQYTFAPTTGQWYYLRVSRASGVCRLYIDTAKVAQENNSTNILASTNPITLYRDGANAFKCDCSMSYVRLTIGAARETTDTISVPTLPYPTE